MPLAHHEDSPSWCEETVRGLHLERLQALNLLVFDIIFIAATIILIAAIALIGKAVERL